MEISVRIARRILGRPPAFSTQSDVGLTLLETRNVSCNAGCQIDLLTWSDQTTVKVSNQDIKHTDLLSTLQITFINIIQL